MKKTCNKCRAFDSGCTLGYETNNYTGHDTYLSEPLEKCPKPKTYKQYLTLLKKSKNGSNNI